MGISPVWTGTSTACVGGEADAGAEEDDDACPDEDEDSGFAFGSAFEDDSEDDSEIDVSGGKDDGCSDEDSSDDDCSAGAFCFGMVVTIIIISNATAANISTSMRLRTISACLRLFLILVILSVPCSLVLSLCSALRFVSAHYQTEGAHLLHQ
ncbi:MAG: hypothetical protein RSF82_09560 [Angelakisella sp.]